MVSRRLFTQTAAGAAAGMILTACGPKRLYEAPKDQLKARIAEMERKYKEQLGKEIEVSDAGPIPGVHFAYALDHFALHRLPPLRVCLRGREQPVARPADPVDPRLSMEKEKGVDFSHADPYYQSRRRSPKKAISTFRWPASSARIRPAPKSAPRAPPGRRKTASW